MKPCDPWRQGLADCALGAPPSAAFSKHLQQCSACSAALRESQARLREIDDGVRQLVASEPSANAAEAILARLGSRARPQPWFSRGMAAATFAALVILAVSVSTLWRWRGKQRDREETLSAAVSISSWRSPTQDLLRSSYDSLLKASPRLGDYFYPVKSVTPNLDHQALPEKEKQKP